MQADFAPGPPFSRRQSGAGLPLAPWALLLWGPGLRRPKHILQGFTLAGKQDCAREGLLRSSPSRALGASSDPQQRGPVAPTAQNELLAAAFCKWKVSSGSKQQPQRASAQESKASRFRPRPSVLQNAKRGGAAPGSLGTTALGAGSPAPETHSPGVLLGGEAGLGARRPSAPRPQPCPRSQLGRSAPRPRGTDGSKRASGSCILQRESLLGQQTTAPTRLGSGEQGKPFSPPALRSPERKEGRGCPWIPGPYCFGGRGLRRQKPIPQGFSLAGKQDRARVGLLVPGASHEP